MNTNEHDNPFNYLDGNRAYLPQDFYCNREEYIQEINNLYLRYKEEYEGIDFTDQPEFR